MDLGGFRGFGGFRVLVKLHVAGVFLNFRFRILEMNEGEGKVL